MIFESVLETIEKGRFLLSRKISSGGFATVYQVFDTLLKKNAAFKIVRTVLSKWNIAER